MTKANDLASLLDANGDVVSSALDNVPAAPTPSLSSLGIPNHDDITVDASGSVLVGKTAESGNTAGHFFSSTGYQRSTRNGSIQILNRITTDGTIIDFQKDGSAVGSIASTTRGGATDIFIGSGDTGIYFTQALDAVAPSNQGSDRDAAIDLGRSANRFKDLYLSGGVYLGGTGSANHLDDYEEGALSLSTTTGTASFIYARYTKVGNLVTIRFQVDTFSDRTTNSAVTISGLPFASSSTGRTSQGVLGRYIAGGGDAIIAYLPQSASSMTFFQTINSSNYVQVKHNHLTSASSNVIVTLTYEAA